MADKIRQARTLFDQQREDYLSRRTRNYVKSWEIPNFGIPSGWKRDLQAEGFILNGRPDYDLPASFMDELYGTNLNPDALPVENLSGKPAYKFQIPGFVKRNWKIGAVGAGLLGLYAIQPLSWFSGRDDNYNTIEGLKHGGFAEKIRKGMTEFGSGWRGMFSGIAKDFNEIAKIIGHTPTTSFQAGLKTPKKNILEAIDETIKQKKIKMITSQEEALKFGLTTKDWEGHALSGALKPEFTGTGYKDYILLNKEGLIDHLSKHRGLTTKEAESILPVVKAHELSEVHHFQTTMSHDIDLAVTHDIRKKMNLFGSHRSGAVIADELLTAASLGSETYQAMRKFRLSELSGIEESLGLFSKKQQKEYIKRTRKIVSSFEQKQLHKFIGADEANRIKLRTSEMSKIQRQGVMQLFKNAISGGKRSKMIYGASKR